MPALTNRPTRAQWGALSQRAQVARLAKAARRAIAKWPLTEVRVKPVNHGENATFRADCAEGSFLIRIHRHGYHSAAEIRSELEWLDFLASEGLEVPRPFRSAQDHYVEQVDDLAITESRNVTVLRWVDGRMYDKVTPVHAARTGRLLAKLHKVTRSFEPSAEFTRSGLGIAEQLHGKFGDLDDVDWLSPDEKERLERTEGALHEAVAALPADPNLLIHADLHTGNTLFKGDHAAAIDFDDCGFGSTAVDLAVAMRSFGWADNADELQSALRSAYDEDHGLPEHFERRLAIWTTVRQMSMLAWIADRSDVADLHARRPGMTKRVLAGCDMFLQGADQ